MWYWYISIEIYEKNSTFITNMILSFTAYTQNKRKNAVAGIPSVGRFFHIIASSGERKTISDPFIACKLNRIFIQINFSPVYIELKPWKKKIPQFAIWFLIPC